MAGYRHILAAVDLAPGEEDPVLGRAAALARQYGARLSLLHVVEYVPPLDLAYDPVVPVGVDIENQLMDRARAELDRRLGWLGVEGAQAFVEAGSPKRETVRFAQENGVDLIVVGTRGRHGLSLLLGSTANGVLHHAPCDVLAVRIHDEAADSAPGD